MRTFYERASDKAHSLRLSLKTCRKCLSERDTQLDIANRIIEKLAKERAALEVWILVSSRAGEARSVPSCCGQHSENTAYIIAGEVV